MNATIENISDLPLEDDASIACGARAPDYTPGSTEGLEGGGDARQSALARGIGLLRCFTTTDSALTGKELIERSGLAKPTAYRAIQTLRDIGLLYLSEQRGRYMLAPGLLAMCAPLLSGMTIRSLARPLMQELADHAQGLVTLTVATDTQQPIFVEICSGRGNTVARPELGTATSKSRTAAGRAWLVLLNEEIREHKLAQFMARDAEGAAWLRTKLEQTREELRFEGFCRNLGELDPITVGVAVPVQTQVDGQRFILACTVPTYRLIEFPNLLEDLGNRLATLGQNVEVVLGTARR